MGRKRAGPSIAAEPTDMRHLTWLLIAAGAMAIACSALVFWREYEQREDDGALTIRTPQDAAAGVDKEERPIAIEVHNGTRSIARVVGFPDG